MAIKHSLTMSLLILLCAGAQAQTQVYETTDAAGNPVFSDAPTENSETVEIPPTNLVISPPAPPPIAITSSSAAPGAATQGAGESHVIVNRDYGRRLARDDEGDGFVTEHTPDGDIIVNERVRERTLREDEEHFIDNDGARQIRVRKGAHKGRH